jgi:hypothetical protein
MARLRRKTRQPDTMRAPATARRKPIQRAEQNPLEAQQHALGNQAVQRLIDSRAVQPKLTVGAPNDVYEQEADRVADQVVGMTPTTAPGSAGAHAVQRRAVHRAGKDEEKKQDTKGKDTKGKETGKKEAGGKEAGKDKKKDDDKAKRKAILDDEKDKKDEEVQREAAEESPVPEVSPALEASLDAQSGGGDPLPESLKEFFEPRIGADLSEVRLHTDQRAAEAAAELEAQAFTRDRDVYFGAGYFEPQSTRGRWLLAHELTHTVQQAKKPGSPDHDPAGGSVEAPFAIVKPAAAALIVVREEDEEEPPKAT